MGGALPEDVREALVAAKPQILALFAAAGVPPKVECALAEAEAAKREHVIHPSAVRRECGRRCGQ